MKQLEADPWEGVEFKYPASAKFKGRVTNITDYGAFVELEPGVEGLVHVSEMSWTKKNVHPGKIVSTSQEVEVMVLDVDPAKRRISLGLKQTLPNPWEAFLEEHPAGSEIEGEVRNTTEFGLFIGLPGDIDGMVHLSDIDWTKPGEEAMQDYRKGQMVKVKVLDVDVEKERISLGIKQLEADPFEAGMASVKKGDVVTATITGTSDTGIDVTLPDGMPGLHPQVRAVARPQRAAPRPLRRRRAGRRQDHHTRSRRPQGDAVDQGARGRRGEEGDGRVRLVRFRREPRRYPGRRDPPPSGRGRRGREIAKAGKAARHSGRRAAPRPE